MAEQTKKKKVLFYTDKEYLAIEIRAIYDKLMFQYKKDNDFINNAVAKSSIPFIEENKGNAETLFKALEEGKKKRKKKN